MRELVESVTRQDIGDCYLPEQSKRDADRLEERTNEGRRRRSSINFELRKVIESGARQECRPEGILANCCTLCMLW
ncbi:uncharacterized protein THITE_151993 [Thermothielavioides terrestris NRRL 8126]|uniref:Uncharacterized protein n=1 Tax=Thermothielavioides terrestris (strain ATCC 38088 / NRRL 8126) TaxID=578455 RepID=G2R108_THETT|nr:uncharacterized protein THITE_151993 [Thermothielavioides terrestris NRRL 8126]AEO66505.1 hypothetical protein THITE_151993 [Thermothielavioides terrestris NRRL 8126]